MFDQFKVGRSSGTRNPHEVGSTIIVVGIAVLPMVSTSLAMVLLYFTIGQGFITNSATFVYGVTNVVVVLLLSQWLTPEAWSTVFRYDDTSLEELLLGVFLAGVGVVIVAPVAVQIAAGVGFHGSPSVPTAESVFGLAIVALVSVMIAPVTEEVLFRGVLFTTLLEAYGGKTAVFVSSLIFGVIHIFVGGLPGVIEAFLLGVGFAVMRYRYENLVGIGISHSLINIFYLVAGLGLLPTVIGG